MAGQMSQKSSFSDPEPDDASNMSGLKQEGYLKFGTSTDVYVSSIRPSRAGAKILSSRPMNAAQLQDLEYGSRGRSPEQILSKTSIVELLLEKLQYASVLKPLLVLSDREYIGQGSQFIVYKSRVMAEGTGGDFLTTIAVKQPKFKFDPFQRFTIGDVNARMHLYHMYMEVMALTHPRLRRHPNIARLLGWASYDTIWHAPLCLIMELAECDLLSFLANSDNMTVQEMLEVCMDVASALDAIHEAEFFHGDLKTLNVLIYRGRERPMAKLADFGSCLSPDTDEVYHGGGTAGWQAPEIEHEHEIARDLLPQADNYSLGLLIWSVLLHRGRTPPVSDQIRRQLLASTEISAASEPANRKLFEELEVLITQLLEPEPSARPRYTKSLMGITLTGIRSPQPSDLESAEHVPKHDDPLLGYTWQVKPVPHFMRADIEARFSQAPTSVPADILFGLFLQNSANSCQSRRVADFQLLIEAARRGYEPAQGVAHRVLEFYGHIDSYQRQAQRVDWLSSAVATGSTLARVDLETLNNTIVSVKLQEFRANGGYNMYYCALYQDYASWPIPIEAKQLDGYNHLHWLAAYGSLESLTAYLDSGPVEDINELSKNGETPLYLACVRGSWPHASMLLEQGGNPCLHCTRYSISCLHWTFALDDHEIEAFVGQLLSKGADIHAVVPENIAYPHYPFYLPAGSALHWAVTGSRRSAIEILLAHGASPTFRNSIDPYRYDRRVRTLYFVDDTDFDIYGPSEVPNEGLSALDLAAMSYDPLVFQVIVDKSIEVQINNVDEEGFGPIHRLSTDENRRTPLDLAYSILPFIGSSNRRVSLIQVLLKLTLKLGGDIDLFTTPHLSDAQRSKKEWSFTRRTPLMLAVEYNQHELVKSLLENGANVHARNPENETALLRLMKYGVDETNYLKCAEILFEHGANVQDRCSSGYTAVLRAAISHACTVVDFLLERGADIQDRLRGEDFYYQDRNIFLLLCNSGITRGRQEEIDRGTAALLEKYVFTLNDPLEIKQIIEDRPVNEYMEGTLLHQCAEALMLKCIEVLLANQTPPNPVANWSTVGSAGKWKCTPIDIVYTVRLRLEREMTERRHLNRQEFERLNDRCGKILEVLRNYGGSSIEGGQGVDLIRAVDIREGWIVPTL